LYMVEEPLPSRGNLGMPIPPDFFYRMSMLSYVKEGTNRTTAMSVSEIYP
jgi:hypothetical protein